MIEDDLKDKLEDKLEDTFKILRDNMELTFEHLDKNPNDMKKVLSIWKNYGDKVYKEFMLMSNKYNNNDIGKEITKMIIFR